MPKMTTELTCESCGDPFKYPAWLAKHALKCQGKVQTRGRIDRLARRPADRTPPRCAADRAQEELARAA